MNTIFSLEGVPRMSKFVKAGAAKIAAYLGFFGDLRDARRRWWPYNIVEFGISVDCAR